MSPCWQIFLKIAEEKAAPFSENKVYGTPNLLKIWSSFKMDYSEVMRLSAKLLPVARSRVFTLSLPPVNE